jgi:SSS family solute:Na+ symporter
MGTWIAFIGYSALAIWLGARAARRAGDSASGADFWTAGRGLSGLEVGVSLSAGFLSISWSCVYAVQLFYWYGLGALWLMTIPWLCALGGIYWLSRRYHGLGAFSQPEMVGQRFGRRARRMVALALAFVFLAWAGAEIYVASNLLAPQMGAPRWLLVLLITSVVGVYSGMGGFRAVVDTDKLQYGIVALYILAMAWLAQRGLLTAGGSIPPIDAEISGPRLLLEIPLSGAKSGLPWSHLLGGGIATIAFTFVAYLPGWLFEADLWLRVQAARDARAARRGVLFAAVNSVLFIGILPAFIGISALALFPMQDGAFPAAIGNEADGIFAALVTQFAPAWLELLVAVGLVAAAMSTIDTCANVVALSVAYDMLRVQERGAAEAAVISRRVTLAALGGAALFALGTESLWDIFYLSSGVLTAAVAFPLAAVFLPWATTRMVTWSSAAGFIGTVATYFLETYGPLTALEPAWVAGSGLGFILWGSLAAAAGALAGRIVTTTA